MASAPSKIPGYSIASLVMGTTGFTVTLFNLTSSAFTVLTTAASLGDDAGVFQAQLTIQEQIFRRWGHGLGITGSEDDLDERLRTETSLFNAVVAGLCSIRKILLNVDDLKSRYGLEATDEITGRGTLLTELRATDILDGETLLREYERRREDAEKTQKRISILKKLRWAITDKEKFEALILLLSKFNNDLYSLISPLDAKIIAKAVAGEILRTTNIVQLANIRRAALGSGTDVEALATRKYNASIILQTPAEVPDMRVSGGLKCLDVKLTAANRRRAVGNYRDTKPGVLKPVIIEWKFVDPTISNRDKDLLESNTRNMAYFLQQEKSNPLTGTLRCLGTTGIISDSDEHKKYGLIYNLPDGVGTGELPISLFDILPDEDDNNDYEELFLGDKFRIAQMLSQALYQLLVSNWLHKSIRSENVSFFQPRSNLSKRTLRSISTEAMFLTGYDFARPGGLKDPTQKAGNIAFDIYAHPLYRGGKVKYSRLFDIYSLGVVLLEIGLWRRIESGVRPDQTPDSVRSMLIQACIDELGPAMGKSYRDAVQCCLEGDFAIEGLTLGESPEPNWDEMGSEEIATLQSKDEQVNGDLYESFYWKVVSPLAKLYAG
jgi:hypothetical protein